MSFIMTDKLQLSQCVLQILQKHYYVTYHDRCTNTK